MINFFY